MGNWRMSNLISLLMVEPSFWLFMCRMWALPSASMTKSYLGLPQDCACQPVGRPRWPTGCFDQSSTGRVGGWAKTGLGGGRGVGEDGGGGERGGGDHEDGVAHGSSRITQSGDGVFPFHPRCLGVPAPARACARVEVDERRAPRQVALGGALLQEPHPGRGGVRWREGRRERADGQ